MDRIYLDNNATTIVDPRVKEAMEPFWCQLYGNPNSLHTFGTEVHPYMRLAFDRLYAASTRATRTTSSSPAAPRSQQHGAPGLWYDLIRQGPKTEIVTTQVEHPACATPAASWRAWARR